MHDLASRMARRFFATFSDNAVIKKVFLAIYFCPNFCLLLNNMEIILVPSPQCISRYHKWFKAMDKIIASICIYVCKMENNF
jgi:hypothetical protein